MASRLTASLRLLCVTAHPDDEAGNFGGALLQAHAAGVDTRLVCLTAGEAARNRGGAASHAELSALRRAELQQACTLLQLGQHEAWEYPDSGLVTVEFRAVATRLAGVLRAWRPHLVLTMGPEGAMTGHPDHGMVGLLTSAAFHWAASAKIVAPTPDAPVWQAQRLFYVTAPHGVPHAPSVLLPPVDLALDITAELDRKIAAFRLHTTQAPLFDRVETFLRSLHGREFYHLASAPPGFDKQRLQSGGMLAGIAP